MKLSVIVPCKNEAGNVNKLSEIIKSTLKDISSEIIFIDDGSTDNTLEELKKIDDIKIISFSKNFNKEAAIYAGLKNSIGEYTCIIDGDLQQDPKYLIKMLNELEKHDYDQVVMVNKKRKEFFLTKIFKKIFYKLMNIISDVDFINGASDFRMFNSLVKKAVLEMSEVNRFSKGLFAWVGFNTCYMHYDVLKRYSGKSKFNFKESIKYALTGIIGFSIKPLKIATLFGIISSISSFIYFFVLLIKTLIVGKDIPGYASMLCVILLLGGIQLITIGILGEYIGRTYIEVKKRPIYLIKEKIGFDESLL